MEWQKGAEWRKWDLHVHSPASYKFSGDWNQLIIQLGNADCDVIGINDYFTVAGYREVIRRLNDPSAADEGNKPYREALEKLKGKTLLPVVECRMNNVVLDKKNSGPRINFHLIFSPEISPDDIETFIKSLKVKGASIGSRYSDLQFLRDEVSVNFGETCQQLRNDGTFAERFLIWIPYDEYGGIDPINPTTDRLFKEGLVSNADILGSSNKEQADFFLWKNGRFTEDQYRNWFGRRKPCIKGSDSHDVNDELGKLKDHHSKPTEKYCWIKGDPTFNGLRQIINEPEDRVYIGRVPPKMNEVRLHPTRYISHVHIRKVADAETDEVWFDCRIPLNSDMVAIIGNKGTGKSALADVLALAGNTHCDPQYFSFLTKERFCERNGRIAKQFEVETVWAEATTTVTSLNSKPDLNDVELVKYIPQTYLEKVCTETEPGQQSEFQRELRKVIFSHISIADRLSKESFDELIDYKAEELTAERKAQQDEIARLNAEIVRLEAKGTADYAAQLAGKITLKRKELEAHETINRPMPVEKPNNLDAAQREIYTQISNEVETERTTLNMLETQIAEHQAKQKTAIEQLALVTKLEGRLANFETAFVRLKQDCDADCKKLSLDVDTLITVTIHKATLTTKRDVIVAEKVKIDTALSLTEKTSLFTQKAACEGRIKALQDKLDAPNKRYQTYQEALKVWQQQKEAIEGDAEKVDTLRYYEAQLKYIQEALPLEIAAVKEERLTAARKVHQSIAAIKDVYKELFASVQELIEGSVIIKEGFKLSFYSSIIERTFQQDLFEKYINQGVAGSFCGKEKGAVMLEELRAEYDFNKADDTIAFVEKVTECLEHDMRTSQQGAMNIRAQLRKHVEPKQLYDYLWSLHYLTPEYSLKLDGKDLNLLSPGERGILLLVFYLLVDQSRSPIIVDQPEGNLDSETVYRLLIPVIKEVKNRRQIIMVTHSPNIAVVCDAEQVIHAFIDRANKNQVIYTMGAIESKQINKFVVDVLEGTRPAFDNRESKYYA